MSWWKCSKIWWFGWLSQPAHWAGCLHPIPVKRWPLLARGWPQLCGHCLPLVPQSHQWLMPHYWQTCLCILDPQEGPKHLHGVLGPFWEVCFLLMEPTDWSWLDLNLDIPFAFNNWALLSLSSLIGGVCNHSSKNGQFKLQRHRWYSGSKMLSLHQCLTTSKELLFKKVHLVAVLGKLWVQNPRSQ